MTETRIPWIKRTLSIEDPDFPAWAAGFIEDGRRAEVLMVARNTAGDLWLHRKGAWRLPTGTIEAGEHPLAAVDRETQEEFGAPLPVVATLAMLRIDTAAAGVQGAFTSHMYLVDAGDHIPQPVVAEGIDAWCLISPQNLERVAIDLRSLAPVTDQHGRRQDFWGAFRAIEHDVASDLLATLG